MKKLFLLLFVFAMLALAACGGNRDVETQQPQNDPATQAPSENIPQTPEPSHERTIEELGGKIVTVGTFWTDLWYFTGTFSQENVDFNQPEPPQHIISIGVRVLPGSGFESLSDIRNFLLQFYVQDEVDRYLGEFPRFAEYSGNLYAFGTRAGISQPDWSRATHELLEQANGHAVVKTTVPFGSWHRPDIDEIGYIHVDYLITFADGRIYRFKQVPFEVES
jgi:hypothetical protein